MQCPPKELIDPDGSVNFIFNIKDNPGYFESRFVKRKPDYFVTYLSSESGCPMGCSFCWLTETKQTMFRHATLEDYRVQALYPILHERFGENSAKTCHFNYMARGEALCNPNILNKSPEHFTGLYELAKTYGFYSKFNISTIIPKTLNKSLIDIFPLIYPTIYYSIYSCNPEFRAKWLPNAMDVDKALDLLTEYQKFSRKIIKLHYALISGENDSFEDVKQIVNKIIDKKLAVQLNLVEYNPPNNLSKESEHYERYVNAFESYAQGYCTEAKIIKRVGYEKAFASCGMFYNGE
jgi:adenine C2-methylase RlmN of 23S rRNA A2503 and tRNA A37